MTDEELEHAGSPGHSPAGGPVASDGAGALERGRVLRRDQALYTLRTPRGPVRCVLAGNLTKSIVPVVDPADPGGSRVRLRVEKIRQTDPIAVGDEVEFRSTGPGSGRIEQILPRRSWISRRGAGSRPVEQVLVSNADQIVVAISAARPRPKWILVDRPLVEAEIAGLPALILVTKVDLADRPELATELEIYESLGYPTLMTSAVTGEGLPELAGRLAGKTSVLVGRSGVGKSSILNRLEPGLGLRVQDVQRTGKGRHTTSHVEMHPVGAGGWIVDTPGVREFVLWRLPPGGMEACFPEMRSTAGSCRFRSDCRHRDEPGCAILEAVAAGRIHARRHASFLRIREDVWGEPAWIAARR